MFWHPSLLFNSTWQPESPYLNREVVDSWAGSPFNTLSIPLQLCECGLEHKHVAMLGCTCELCLYLQRAAPWQLLWAWNASTGGAVSFREEANTGLVCGFESYLSREFQGLGYLECGLEHLQELPQRERAT